MSYILEALKKSDAERQAGPHTPQDAPAPTPEAAPIGEPEPETTSEFEYETVEQIPPSLARTPLPVTTTPAPKGLAVGWTITGVLGLAAAGLGAVYLMRAEPAPAPLQTSMTIEQAKVTPPAPPQPTPLPTPLPKTTPEPVAPMPEVMAEPEPTPEHAPKPAPKPIGETIAPPSPEFKPVTKPELSVVDELPPQAKAALKKSNTLAVAKPRSGTAPAIERPPSKPVIITAPKINPKKKTKAQRANEDAQKSLRQVNLAWSAIKRGQYNQAIRELDTAVKLVPNNADAWFARGWANEKSGKELSAIGDYARAIKSKPNHLFALFSRGYLNLYVGSPQDAITDFVRASGVTEEPAFKLYTHLWLHLSRMRVIKSGNVEFNDEVERENLGNWPGPLIRYAQGKLSEDAVLSTIERGTDAQVREQRCTGFFFLGIQALEAGNEKKARSYFERALATGAVQFRQYDAAKRELERLKL
ncbi:tetratricopeptide repeat protein [Magnetovibrio sp. PR-2]|uniref:tetratricopeptide repeat protein n=1 Tax=Magnetovibrio sp. PR-2 TaxID=3120356 RepID=UPI002FCE0AAF